ncbi:MAG: hypothetical protein HW421_2374 [Ignavibacteria bacterium]|nr:hypothetical protein [Ignavibacteria bacterium]
MSLFNWLKSSILSKVVMALTGVLLVAFVCGHTLGNMLIYLGKEEFNAYAQFLQSLGEILWLIRITLFLALILHIIAAIRVKFLNMASKPVKYQVRRYVKAKLTSRTMLWTGSMVLAFLAYHLLHFTIGVTNPKDFHVYEYYAPHNAYGVLPSGAIAKINEPNSKITQNLLDQFESQASKQVMKRHDVYKMVVLGFKNPWISLCYFIGVILLGFHLNHAIQSMFQTLGINHPKYDKCLRNFSPVLSTIIVICMISIPINILLGLTGGAL